MACMIKQGLMSGGEHSPHILHQTEPMLLASSHEALQGSLLPCTIVLQVWKDMIGISRDEMDEIVNI